MSTLKNLRPITVEEYLEGENCSPLRHEFVGGEVYAMVGASEGHNLIVMNIAAELHGKPRGTACRVFSGMMKLRINENFFYPDVFVVCDRADTEPRFKTHPVLVVEVLSPSTVIWDSREKRAAYQAVEPLREYVLVEQERREVRMHRRAGSGWETTDYTGAAAVELASVNLTLSLDDIYRDVLP